MVVYVVLGWFGAGDVCQLDHGLILVWRRTLILLFLGKETRERVENLRMMLQLCS